MATYHEAIPQLIFEIFYTKLRWSSRLSDIHEKRQEICQSTCLLHYLWECQRRDERATSEASCEVVNRNTAPKAHFIITIFQLLKFVLINKISVRKTLVPYQIIKIQNIILDFTRIFYPIILISLSHPAVKASYTVE